MISVFAPTAPINPASPASPIGLVGGALLGAGFVAQARLLDVSAAFEIRANRWSRRFSPGPEIRAYIEGVAHRFGVFDKVRTGDLGGGANTAEFTRALIGRIGR